MSVVLREPADQIYVQDRMPFIFLNEDMTNRVEVINQKVEQNIKEAAVFSKNTGAMSRAKLGQKMGSRLWTAKNSVAGSSTTKSGKMKSGQKVHQLMQPSGGDNLECKRVSFKRLDSATGFRVGSRHQDKLVNNYLKEWTQGKAALPTDWFKQVENGRITNV